MHPDLAISLDRADELLKELLAEYDRSLHDKKVGTRAVQLTHEVFERLRGVLDRVARLYWERKVAPQLSEDDRDAAAVYFPIAPDQHSLDSILGGWRWKSVRDQHQPVYEFLRSLQPFINKSNEWLATLNDLTVQGKHLDLVPQKRTEQRVTTVPGAPIDPRTRRIVPTPGVTEKVEIWVSFEIQGYGVDAASFAGEICRKVRHTTCEMSNTFGLS